MKKFLVSLVTLILTIGLVAGCGGVVKANIDPEETINVSVGQDFVIALDSNPTTGYNWEVSYDEAILSLVSEEYKTEKEPGLVGVGGTQYFTFKGLEKGSTAITLTYKRSWETESLEQKDFTVDIK